MTAKQALGQKPEPVRDVILVMMTKASLQDHEPDPEKYAFRALEHWEEFVAACPGKDEVKLAEEIILSLHPEWGVIMREAKLTPLE